MAFVQPAGYSKGALDRAGERIRAGEGTGADLSMLDNWRASHLYVINTFQSSLRFRRKRSDADVTIAQRLKRQPTIIDKLTREPGMALSRMHDIAGCRLIFPEIDGLTEFRNGVLNSRANHRLVGDKDRYDYILHPKNTGYRGIHDVYIYDVASEGGKSWNGLRIELQYRTYTQHAWATAVEISDIVNRTRLKFNQANEDLSRLFLLSSEILSRTYEAMPGFCADLETQNILSELIELEHKLHAIDRLRNLTSSEFHKIARTHKLFILVNFTAEKLGGEFFAEGFSDNKSAVERYAELEKQYAGLADVVLVGATEADAVKLAYTNYFSDASMFIGLLDHAVEHLRDS
jgi:putative GTP pyrophosphokinase